MVVPLLPKEGVAKLLHPTSHVLKSARTAELYLIFWWGRKWQWLRISPLHRGGQGEKQSGLWMVCRCLLKLILPDMVVPVLQHRCFPLSTHVPSGGLVGKVSWNPTACTVGPSDIPWSSGVPRGGDHVLTLEPVHGWEDSEMILYSVSFSVQGRDKGWCFHSDICCWAYVLLCSVLVGAVSGCIVFISMVQSTSIILFVH